MNKLKGKLSIQALSPSLWRNVVWLIRVAHSHKPPSNRLPTGVLLLLNEQLILAKFT